MNMASNNSSEVPVFGTSFEVISYLALNSSLLVFFAFPGLLLIGLLMVTLAGLIAKKLGRVVLPMGVDVPVLVWLSSSINIAIILPTSPYHF